MNTKKSRERKPPRRIQMMEEMALNQEKIYSLRLSHGIIPECLYENFPREYIAIPKNNDLKN